MKLSTILSALPTPPIYNSAQDPEINQITTDSRTAETGNLFIAIRGMQHDAHAYLSDAAKKGCIAAVVESDYVGEDYGMLLVRTTDTRAASAYLYSRFYGDPQNSLKIICVTGTNGKTSVCHMLRAIYRTAGIKAEVIGTIGQRLTTPDPQDLYRMLREHLDQGNTTIIMEASSHALALRKLLPIHPDYAIFTNLTPDHLDFHHTMSEYLAAKAILFRQCKIGIVNLDDNYSPDLRALADCRLITYSSKSDSADFTARNQISLGIGGIRYDCLTHNRLFRVQSPIPGSFTVSNTLAAVTCAYTDGISPDCIRYALRGMDPIPGRMERIPLPSRKFTVYLDFAHTPDALDNILKTLRSSIPAESRLTVLFGCGGERDKQKRPVMGRIASRLADHVIITSDNSRGEDPDAIIRDILTGIDRSLPHTVITSRRNAIIHAIETISEGDVLLLAGKGHETIEIDKNGKHPFSERLIVREAYEKRFGS